MNRAREMRCSKCGFVWSVDLSSRFSNANRKVIEMMKNDGKKEIKVKVNFDRSDSQPEADNEWEPPEEPKPLPKPQPLPQPLPLPQPPPQQQQQQQPQQQPLLATTPSWTPSENQWQPMPINEWEPQQQMVIGNYISINFSFYGVITIILIL